MKFQIGDRVQINAESLIGQLLRNARVREPFIGTVVGIATDEPEAMAAQFGDSTLQPLYVLVDGAPSGFKADPELVPEADTSDAWPVLSSEAMLVQRPLPSAA